MDKHEILRSVFGHDVFREGQEYLIDAMLSGRDVLCVMPTGAGKSICYQLPALMLPGITLVISPLISLMKDQVMALKGAGVAAAYFNSSLTPAQQNEAVRRAALGAYRIIYVAPERLDTEQFAAFAQNADISLIAVDEAHCVSQWGQDFRPSYLRIASFVDRLPKRPPIGAFTATATQPVKEDIIRYLRLREPRRVTTGYNRPNLRFMNVKPTNRFLYLCEYLNDVPEECGIIYCSTRKNVEEVMSKLCLQGYSATRYHAGLSDAERKRNQEDFQYDRVKLMVATNAFGMGIDKSNVRFVIHYNMPMNLESYYQEAGRAGRDGAPADCVLIYSGQDVITAKWMIEHSDENQEITDDQRAELKQRDMERLRQMTFYATSGRCLRRFILNYFGEFDVPEKCGNCSPCNGEAFEIDNGRAPRVHGASRNVLDKEEKRIAREQRAYLRRNKEREASAEDEALLNSLKVLRARIAAGRHVPAYIIFSDTTLYDMLLKRPDSLEAFREVSGVGKSKLEWYGELFLRVLHGAQAEKVEIKSISGKSDSHDSTGRPWTDAEEAALRDEFDRELTLRSIAEAHNRTPGAIQARLRKMELIE